VSSAGPTGTPGRESSRGLTFFQPRTEPGKPCFSSYGDYRCVRGVGTQAPPVRKESFPLRAFCGDIAEERPARRPRPEACLELAWASHLDLLGHQVLHRLLRLPPWAAVPVNPAGTRVISMPSRSASRTACAIRLALFAQKIHRPARDPDIDLQEDEVPKPRGFHRLKVSRHPLARQVAIHEVPIASRACGVRRVAKGACQILGSGGEAVRAAEGQDQAEKRCEVAHAEIMNKLRARVTAE